MLKFVSFDREEEWPAEMSAQFQRFIMAKEQKYAKMKQKNRENTGDFSREKALRAFLSPKSY
ncbi:MAG: hypothetical protein HC890_01100 [Chloroflexaceae bacterium]|nr:hypothetical protein [Chloroflexaceae bacterium]